MLRLQRQDEFNDYIFYMVNVSYIYQTGINCPKVSAKLYIFLTFTSFYYVPLIQCLLLKIHYSDGFCSCVNSHKRGAHVFLLRLEASSYKIRTVNCDGNLFYIKNKRKQLSQLFKVTR